MSNSQAPTTPETLPLVVAGATKASTKKPSKPKAAHKASEPTTLQMAMIDAIEKGLKATGMTKIELSRRTGLDGRYMRELLSGHAAGSVSAWDRLFSVFYGYNATSKT